MATQPQTLTLEGTLADLVGRKLPQIKKPLQVLVALSIGMTVWHMPPPAALDPKGIHFLATLAVAVTLWILEVFDEYIVGLMLLMAWVALDIVTPQTALAGFSQSSWFFVVAALGIGAAVKQSGILERLSIWLLNRIPLTRFKTHTFALFVSGLLITPLLPTGKARAAIASPISQAVSRAGGVADRSNGSAALGLSALLGFTQMSFMFLTGAEFCLIGWNLLPEQARSEFGWLTWLLAGLPAGIVILLFLFAAIHFLFPLRPEEKARLLHDRAEPQLNGSRAFTPAEKITVTVLTVTLTGFLTKPFHGIDETWIALSGLLLFLATGCLDRKTFRNNVDWGLVLFFGVVNSMAVISSQLKVDYWVMELVAPILSSTSLGPVGFLTAVVLIVITARFVLRKAAAAAVLTFALIPLGQAVGIHPGVLLLCILMANECFLFSYQDGPYLLSYLSTDGRAFSHSQARRVLVAKMLATIAAVAVSVPYWKLLRFIQ